MSVGFPVSIPISSAAAWKRAISGASLDAATVLHNLLVVERPLSIDELDALLFFARLGGVGAEALAVDIEQLVMEASDGISDEECEIVRAHLQVEQEKVVLDMSPDDITGWIEQVIYRHNWTPLLVRDRDRDVSSTLRAFVVRMADPQFARRVQGAIASHVTQFLTTYDQPRSDITRTIIELIALFNVRDAKPTLRAFVEDATYLDVDIMGVPASVLAFRVLAGMATPTEHEILEGRIRHPLYAAPAYAALCATSISHRDGLFWPAVDAAFTHGRTASVATIIRAHLDAAPVDAVEWIARRIMDAFKAATVGRIDIVEELLRALVSRRHLVRICPFEAYPNPMLVEDAVMVLDPDESADTGRYLVELPSVLSERVRRVLPPVYSYDVTVDSLGSLEPKGLTTLLRFSGSDELVAQ